MRRAVRIESKTNEVGPGSKGRQVKSNQKCETARYKTVALYDFIYKHACVPAGWIKFFQQPAVEKEIRAITPKLLSEAQQTQIEPPMRDIFNAFEGIEVKTGAQMMKKKTDLEDVKVVILGQDPVPTPGMATGMAFSLNPNVEPSEVPSVLNMLVELMVEKIPLMTLSSGDLTPWRKQGVLLLNAALTVRQGTSRSRAGSHSGWWKPFTRELVKYISSKGGAKAWLLWGNDAQAFESFIQRKDKNYVRAGWHPSSQSAKGFFGGHYFTCANEFLQINNRKVINWMLTPNPKSPSIQQKICQKPPTFGQPMFGGGMF